MRLNETAFLFIGYQNDYFSNDGILNDVVEESNRTRKILHHSLELIEKLKEQPVLLIDTPIIFTEDYSELIEPVGILKAIREVQAFKAGTRGAETIDEFLAYGDRFRTILGKRGLNAFSNTDLAEVLLEQSISHLVLAGAVTSICIDSTGRSAHEQGFSVTILSDCTASRSTIEQEFYCENVFPLYASVMTSGECLHALGLEES